MEDINLFIPKDVTNLKIPSYSAVKEWEDIENRIIKIDAAINDPESYSVDTDDIIDRIIKYNREDKITPVELRKPIYLYIDSPGGDAIGTYSLINVMKMSKTPIYTLNVGISASAAALILASGHKRYSIPGSSCLVHTGFVGYGGNREQVESAKKHFDGIDKKLTDMLIENTKIDMKTYKTKAPKDWWMTTEDCLKYGIIDKVIENIDEIL